MVFIRLFFSNERKKNWNNVNLKDKTQPLIDACRYSTESKRRVEEWQTYGLPLRHECLSLDDDGVYDVGEAAFWRAMLRGT